MLPWLRLGPPFILASVLLGEPAWAQSSASEQPDTLGLAAQYLGPSLLSSPAAASEQGFGRPSFAPAWALRRVDRPIAFSVGPIARPDWLPEPGLPWGLELGIPAAPAVADWAQPSDPKYNAGLSLSRPLSPGIRASLDWRVRRNAWDAQRLDLGQQTLGLRLQLLTD